MAEVRSDAVAIGLAEAHRLKKAQGPAEHAHEQKQASWKTLTLTKMACSRSEDRRAAEACSRAGTH